MVPLRVGSGWEVAAPAKLNLFLEVLGKRTDGFHDLETLMVPVQLCDQLRWSRQADTARAEGRALTLTVRRAGLAKSQTPEPLENAQNLILRAAHLLAEHMGIEPFGHFELTKRIPIEAGLGGGSSDAAAALLLANAGWGAGLTTQELLPLAERLGSDVPFFVNGGAAVCRGRGEKVEKLGEFPHLHFVIVKPLLGLSTPRVFSDLDIANTARTKRSQDSQDRLRSLVDALQRGAIGMACRWMSNRLEDSAIRILPEISRIKVKLAELGCWGQFMTGSGSAVVGVARTASHVKHIVRSLMAQRLGTVFATTNGW